MGIRPICSVSESLTGHRHLGTGSVSGLYILVSSVASHDNGQTLCLMTHVSLSDWKGASGPGIWQVLAYEGTPLDPLETESLCWEDTFCLFRQSKPLMLGSSKARCLSRHTRTLVRSPCLSMSCPGLGLNHRYIVFLALYRGWGGLGSWRPGQG